MVVMFLPATAAIGMIYEGMEDQGLSCIENIRTRYDGRKRNPFNEAECGHNYARAMASWGAVPALSGFQYSAVEQSMTIAASEGSMFWSNGNAWGVCKQTGTTVELSVYHGNLKLNTFTVKNSATTQFTTPLKIASGETATFELK